MRNITLDNSIITQLEQHANMLYDFGFEQSDISTAQMIHDVTEALTPDVIDAMSNAQFGAACNVLKYKLLAIFASVYDTAE